MRHVVASVVLCLCSGCGSAVFYDEAPADDDRGQWHESMRDTIRQPPDRLVASDDRACADDLAGVKAQVSQAIEIAIAHHDWDRQRCLSQKAQTAGTLYHAAMSSTFRDQSGMDVAFRGTCSAAEIARQARACANGS